MENMFKFMKKRENIVIIIYTENTSYCSDVYSNISFRNWIMPFKLSRLLVTHDGGKLSRVGELSLAECLQGR